MFGVSMNSHSPFGDQCTHFYLKLYIGLPAVLMRAAGILYDSFPIAEAHEDGNAPKGAAPSQEGAQMRMAAPVGAPLPRSFESEEEKADGLPGAGQTMRVAKRWLLDPHGEERRKARLEP
jgi:hypothetical protein